MLEILIKPINQWIGPETKKPIGSRFNSTYSSTKTLLQTELAHLGAYTSSLQLEMFIDKSDLILDGSRLRANHKPYKPGVVLSFSRMGSNGEPQTLSYPCDTYDHWQDNVRAIALSLEKLRAVSRYGVFKYEDMVHRLSLPEMSSDDAFDQLADLLKKHYPGQFSADSLRRHDDIAKKAYRVLVKRFHPDNKETGDREAFETIQNCKNLLIR